MQVTVKDILGRITSTAVNMVFPGDSRVDKRATRLYDSLMSDQGEIGKMITERGNHVVSYDSAEYEQTIMPRLEMLVERSFDDLDQLLIRNRGGIRKADYEALMRPQIVKTVKAIAEAAVRTSTVQVIAPGAALAG